MIIYQVLCSGKGEKDEVWWTICRHGDASVQYSHADVYVTAKLPLQEHHCVVNNDQISLSVDWRYTLDKTDYCVYTVTQHKKYFRQVQYTAFKAMFTQHAKLRTRYLHTNCNQKELKWIFIGGIILVFLQQKMQLYSIRRSTSW